MANGLSHKQIKEQRMESQLNKEFRSKKDLTDLKHLKGNVTKKTKLTHPTSKYALRFQNDEIPTMYLGNETRDLPENHQTDPCLYSHLPNAVYQQYSQNNLNGKLQCIGPPRAVNQLQNGYLHQDFFHPLSGPSTSESNCSTISKVRQHKPLQETSFSTKNPSFGETYQYFSDNSTVERPFITNSEDEIQSSIDQRQTKSSICCLDATEAGSSFSQTSSMAHPWKNYYSNYNNHSKPTAWQLSGDNANYNHYVMPRADSLSQVLENASAQKKYSSLSHAAQYSASKKLNHQRYEKNKTSFNQFPTKKLTRGSVLRKTQRRKRNRPINQSQARRNSALLAKNQSYTPSATLANEHVPDNFYSALFAMLLCFPPLGLASLVYSYKVREYLAKGNFEKAHQSSLLGRKLANTGIMLGMTMMAFGLIFFALRINIPYTGNEYDYSLQEWINR